jgi:branched-chain amino acid transport system permease protein
MKNALISGLIALVLALPLAGLVTTPDETLHLGLVFHPLPVAVISLGAFLARLAWGQLHKFKWPPLPKPHVAGLALWGLPVVALLPLLGGRRGLDIGLLVLTYMMLATGLNIVVGLAGLLDLGYVAFYAIGAYSTALLTTTAGFGFWTALPVAGLMAAMAGLLLGIPVLRLRGDYLAIVTLGFGEIVRVVLLNWQSLTNGANGIIGVPYPRFFGLDFSRFGTDSVFRAFGLPFWQLARPVWFYLLALGLTLAANLVVARLRRAPIGRAWEALREDEIAARALGLDPVKLKLGAFASGAFFAGLAGAFFAARQGFVSPDSFTFSESALVLAIVVMGGAGRQIGVVWAAIVMIGGFELVRDFAQYRMLIFGAALICIAVARPGGLFALRLPSVRLRS